MQEVGGYLEVSTPWNVVDFCSVCDQGALAGGG